MSVESDLHGSNKPTPNPMEPYQDVQSGSKSLNEDGKRLEISPASTQTEKPRNMSTLAWVSVVISLLFSMFLFSLDNVIVADIQPSIIKTLGNVDKLPWVSVGYALGGTAVNLTMYVLP